MQQRHAPRPLPLFLELVRSVSRTDAKLAAKALEGLARYERAERLDLRPSRPNIASAGGATLRDCGGSGRPVVLVPSLINPPDVLDLDEEVSLADSIAKMRRHVFLLDWGPASQRTALDLGGHVEQLLLPLLREIGERPALIGYCLGGTMAIAAANIVAVERVATLAAPWCFRAYPQQTRDSLLRLWESAKAPSSELNALPMEVLQSAFWSLDPQRTVSKFADFAALEPGSPNVRRFVTLEDWANRGEPLPYPAARELIEDLFGRDLPGSGEWRIGPKAMSDSIACPLLNITAATDRIAPADTAAAGASFEVQSGHVGMIVGSARIKVHEALAGFLA